MSKVFKSGPAKPEMNMTPLIDVTFLIIIFFMLVNNIIAEESVEMIVPQLQQPKTRALGKVDRITVNVMPQAFVRKERDDRSPLDHPGEAIGVKIGIAQYNINDLEGIAAALERAKRQNEKIEIVLRADSALFYASVAPIMEAIAQAKINQVNLVAFLPESETNQTH